MLETNEYYLNLARQYLEEGMERKARGIILTYRQYAPKDADFHVQWAELCAELGMTKQARESYEQAIHLSPDHAENITLYASFLYDLGYYEEALHYLKKAIKKDPAYKKARDLLAEAYLSLGMDGLAMALGRARPKKANRLRYFPPSIGREDTARFLDLFISRENGYALQELDNRKGMMSYNSREAPLSEKEVEGHLKGEITLAGLPLGPDKTVKFGIIEIRIRRRILESNLKNKGYLIYLGENALEHARTLQRLAQSGHIPAYIEDSADHSHRLWFFFRETVHFLRVKSFLKRFLKEGKLFDSRFIIEPLLPTQGTGLGWLEEPLFLPLGVHRQTMKRSLFVDPVEARPYKEQLKFLKTIQPVPFNEILKWLRSNLIPSISFSSDRLDILTAKLRRKCPVLDILCRKALGGQVLTQTERVILFYTVGLVDINGLSIHRLLESCPDYHYQKVEKQRQRLKSNPISCIKIRELVPEITAEVRCACSFDLQAGHYPSPLLYINPHLVPVEKDLAIPDDMPVREAAKRYIRVTDQIRDLERAKEKIVSILNRHHEKSGLRKIDLGKKSVCHREVDRDGSWFVEFRV